ncbi:MAG: DUF2240 family protein [Candidatus Odinarchaeota archaeon]
MSFEKYIIEIIKETGLSRKELQKMVIQKNKKLSGAVSIKKALFIIAKELCVDLSSS